MAAEEVIDPRSLISESQRRACRGEIQPVSSYFSLGEIVQQLAEFICTDANWLWLSVSIIFMTTIFYYFLRRVVTGQGLIRRRRYTNLLMGLPSSGKTALLSRLVTGNTTAKTQTSIAPNTEVISGVTIVDYPGHRRLREGFYRYLGEAKRVLVVVDSVTIHDERYEGANAVAELLLAMLNSIYFDGVRELIFVCTKRDEVTSYSAKAVAKLLQTAMADSIRFRKGDLSQVDTVRDGTGSVVGQTKSAATRCGYSDKLYLEEDGTFSFEQLCLPVRFVEVSAFPEVDKHKFGVQPLLDIIIGQ